MAETPCRDCGEEAHGIYMGRYMCVGCLAKRKEREAEADERAKNCKSVTAAGAVMLLAGCVLLALAVGKLIAAVGG